MSKESEIQDKREYTYKDLTKPAERDLMSRVDVCSLGTQSGGFGKFNGRFKVVSEDGIASVIRELVEISATNSVLLQDLLEDSDTIKKLISGCE